MPSRRQRSVAQAASSIACTSCTLLPEHVVVAQVAEVLRRRYGALRSRAAPRSARRSLLDTSPTESARARWQRPLPRSSATPSRLVAWPACVARAAEREHQRRILLRRAAVLCRASRVRAGARDRDRSSPERRAVDRERSLIRVARPLRLARPGRRSLRCCLASRACSCALKMWSKSANVLCVLPQKRNRVAIVVRHRQHARRARAAGVARTSSATPPLARQRTGPASRRSSFASSSGARVRRGIRCPDR